MAGRPGYYTHGGPSRSGDKPRYRSVDKDPYYKTTDILNRVYKKEIRLKEGQHNQTDLKTIWVNFGETFPSPIIQFLSTASASNSVYLLECGHEWEGNSGYPIDGSAMGACVVCGGGQSYLGFEHEWQHIIFKSDLAIQRLFVEAYSKTLLTAAPDVDPNMLPGFLHLVINAFDDIRCNSLWEKVYPGSAGQIWERWERLTRQLGDNAGKSFLSFLFAVAFNVPTDPKGEFESLRPAVEWGMQKVRYRGFSNMLVEVRAVLDRCMGALLENMKKPQPQPQQGNNGQQGQQPQDPQPQVLSGDKSLGDGSGDGDPDSEGETDGSGDQEPSDSSAGTEVKHGAGSGDQAGQDSEEGGQEGEGEEQDNSRCQAPTQVPSASQVRASPAERSDALSKLMKGAQGLDADEVHMEPLPEQLLEAKNSQSSRAMLQRALHQDIEDIEALDASFSDEPDEDMQQAIKQLQDGMASVSKDSLLIGDAKSKLILIDVTRDGVHDDTRVLLSPEEDIEVRRMRSAFYKSMGRQKAKRSSEGSVLDVQALTAYKLERQDADVFEDEAVQQGFAYSILCDMSGSMAGIFTSVCHAAEMLKQALYFPFVTGSMWGFRGGEQHSYASKWGSSRAPAHSEVWMYRYKQDVKGYTGTGTSSGWNKKFPVACGGLTPMNPAVNVVVNHLRQRVAQGMAKRLFILTDGSPMYNKVSGDSMPGWMLRKFVAKEINLGRKHGIQVYTLVLAGDAVISDAECREMFGQDKFWRRVEYKNDETQVGKVLSRLVLDNFQKYLRTR